MRTRLSVRPTTILHPGAIMITARIAQRSVLGFVCLLTATVAMYGTAPQQTTGNGVSRGSVRVANPDDPDWFNERREDLDSAARAADLWAARAAADFEAAWKLSRVCYWLGTHAPQSDRRAALNRGIDAGETAVRLMPGRPEGYFWLGADLGALAESSGSIQRLKYRGRIKNALEHAIMIAPGWRGGAAEAALGQWYFKVPRLLGGSRTKAEAYLRRALRYDPDSLMTLSYLANVVAADGRVDEARVLLQQVIDTPADPEWIPEAIEFKRKAARRLTALDK